MSSNPYGYGSITWFAGISETQARMHIDFMVDNHHILDFQFYDVFYNYSQPMQIPSNTIWETKCSTLIDGKYKQRVDLNIVRVYISHIHKRGGRAWLYAQAIADESPNLKNYTMLPHEHIVNGQTLFYCYMPDANWAQRMADIWAPFAKYLDFDGIHWDSLGYLGGILGDGSVFTTFLSTTKNILMQCNLLQTFNFVDGFGWNPLLYKNDIIAFPYWEVWTLPLHEDHFFNQMSQLVFQNDKRPVFVCYSHGPHNPPVNCPLQLAHDRFINTDKRGCRYLMFGDGNRWLKSEYFPYTLPYIPYMNMNHKNPIDEIRTLYGFDAC